MKDKRDGLSRSEVLGRVLARERTEGVAAVSADDLAAFAASFSDLLDENVMDAAWSCKDFELIGEITANH